MTEQTDAARCEWCGVPISLVDGTWTDDTYRSGDYCPEGLDVGDQGTSPHKLAIEAEAALAPSEPDRG